MRVLGGVEGAGESRGVVEVKACVEGDCTSDAFDGNGEGPLFADVRGLPPNADMKERTVRMVQHMVQHMVQQVRRNSIHRTYLCYGPS